MSVIRRRHDDNVLYRCVVTETAMQMTEAVTSRRATRGVALLHGGDVRQE